MNISSAQSEKEISEANPALNSKKTIINKRALNKRRFT